MLASSAMQADSPPIPPGWCAPAERLWRRGQRMPAIQAAVAHANTMGRERPAPIVLQLAYYLYLINDFRRRGHPA